MVRMFDLAGRTGLVAGMSVFSFSSTRGMFPVRRAMNNSYALPTRFSI